MTKMILFKMQAEYLFNGTVISELGGGKKLLVIFLGILMLVVVDYLQYNNFDIVKKNIFLSCSGTMGDIFRAVVCYNSIWNLWVFI